ncbi:uncharacterized protein LACBIDRAFT_309749 [Laccaria bicolor S238N-H82]|uniref:Predicted protein n=1 Tax=Laccaria bicolor (strain S238N-H82 / ATCC MYA-4686) TaxID=486041 RepID=B0DT00_LACBS|nr:uncharacterized protein LACBIDRAFT_309749 [Laccaria bicolor S238N-H82]EDR02325.1 predicted protein [Laccaria bicolor S238N-H82]|eukprot:XP_001887002.1 predicted protein [Laccaria bicolor S238N-H82]
MGCNDPPTFTIWTLFLFVMFDNSQNVTIAGESQVTNVGGDAITHYAPVTNHNGPVINHNAPITNHNAPVTHHSFPDPSTLKRLGRSLAPLDVQSKLPKWTPKNRLFRAKQRKSRALDILEKFDDVMTPGTLARCEEILCETMSADNIEDRGWLSFLWDSEYRDEVIHYTTTIKNAHYLAQTDSEHGVLLEAMYVESSKT